MHRCCSLRMHVHGWFSCIIFLVKVFPAWSRRWKHLVLWGATLAAAWGCVGLGGSGEPRSPSSPARAVSWAQPVPSHSACGAPGSAWTPAGDPWLAQAFGAAETQPCWP